jgi:hypothetical protein
MPAGSTYTPIATTTFGSSANSYTFTSIPSTYTDLILVVNSGNVSGNPSLTLQFNGDTGNNYSMTNMRGNGTSASSSSQSTTSYINFNFVDMSTTITSNYIIHIMNYSNTTTNKTALGRFNNANTGTQATVGLWRSTSAINAVRVFTDNGVSYLANSTFTLYGIASA